MDEPALAMAGTESMRDGDALRVRLERLREEILAYEERFGEQGDSLPEPGRRSALNLLHYLALRRGDLRVLQEELAELGLSSLGRAESHVLATLDAVLGWLSAEPGGRPPLSADPAPPISRRGSRALLAERAEALFGAPPAGRTVRIMVTAPDEAAERYELVRELVASGMDCLRINCAHGDPAMWERMITHLRRAEREEGTHCALLMDLPGPRARTGAMEPGPRVVRIQPTRDELGRVTRPAEVWLTAQEDPEPPPTPADAVLPIARDLLASLGLGDRLVFRDGRDARRALRVVAVGPAGARAHATRTAYVVAGTPVRRVPLENSPGMPGQTGRIGPLPATRRRIPLARGDRLILTRSAEPGRGAVLDPTGRATAPARIPCTPAEVLDSVRVGEAIWFDEGRIGGTIEAVGDDGVVVLISSARETGATLAAEKGINLPESDLRLPALMPADLAILPFVVRHADLVGYSFVRNRSNVEELVAHLDELGGRRPGVVLKIETVGAFRELPGILLAALRHPPMGVMIARGDLAVECGFARLAEVQEEILWLCEAAHIPVIWATQVLDKLAKKGRPSRAEVTDAAVAERAECVMLNKGPYIVDAVRALASILERMQAHQEKKQSLLRELQVADSFLAR